MARSRDSQVVASTRADGDQPRDAAPARQAARVPPAVAGGLHRQRRVDVVGARGRQPPDQRRPGDRSAAARRRAGARTPRAVRSRPPRSRTRARRRTARAARRGVSQTRARATPSRRDGSRSAAPASRAARRRAAPNDARSSSHPLPNGCPTKSCACSSGVRQAARTPTHASCPVKHCEPEPLEQRARGGVELLADAVGAVADQDDVRTGAAQRDRRGAAGGSRADDRDAAAHRRGALMRRRSRRRSRP